MSAPRPQIAFDGLEVDLDPIGARTAAVRFHGRDMMLPVPLDFDPMGPWAHNGAIIGPVGNRFTTGAHLPGWDGPTDGRVVLHGDQPDEAAGVHHAVWEQMLLGPRHARFALALPSGHGGFTANRALEVRYSLPRANTLRMELLAQTDAPTLMTLTHHPYWALGPEPGTEGHRLQVLAKHMLPTDAETRPTGELMAVAGTEFDFNIPRTLHPAEPPLDNTFCLANARTEEPRPVAHLEAPDGWAMELWTTEPGLIVFDGRITGDFDGHAAYAGCCLEPQFWPDAPRHRHFPKMTLAPGETSLAIIEYRFKVGNGRMRTSAGLPAV